MTSGIERHGFKGDKWREFLALRDAPGLCLEGSEGLKSESIIEILKICCCHNSVSDLCL